MSNASITCNSTWTNGLDSRIYRCVLPNPHFPFPHESAGPTPVKWRDNTLGAARDETKADFGVSIGDVRNGYPCPKCETTLALIEGGPRRDAGAWCPSCKTVWRLLDEVSLADLDASPESGDSEVDAT